MNHEEAFIEKNSEAWAKLEEYNKILSKKSISKLSRDEVKEYTTLFRTAGHHLSYAKTNFEGSKSVIYLNQLLGLSHSYFYTRQKAVWHDIFHYFTVGFPAKFREYNKYFSASVCAFLLGAILIMLLAYQDNSYIFYFLPESMVVSNNIIGELSNETWYFPYLSSYIMTNNIRVSAMAVAYGALLGAGTVYVLFYNGIIMGAIYAMVLLYNMNQTRFWSLILPHGFIELTAIFISGAAGLIIGKFMLIPGSMTRRGSFVKGAKEAFFFLPGIAVMLVIAGIIEGFFTPLNIPEIIKLIFAFITLALIIVYFGLCGRPVKNKKP